VGARPIFLAASTHPGEEELVLQSASELRKIYHDLLTVIVPRHPHRGEEIGVLAGARDFSSVRRATGALSGPATQVYIADTMGELGLFYRAAPFAFLGGSLVPKGGQNPLEPARLGTPVIAGPYTQNFEEIFRVLLEAQGWGRVKSPAELTKLVLNLMADPARAPQFGTLAKTASNSLSGALAVTLETAEKLLAQNARS
jgi:3-deoxy-D-manno-octulosonic-acid transferase